MREGKKEERRGKNPRKDDIRQSKKGRKMTMMRKKGRNHKGAYQSAAMLSPVAELTVA